MKDLLGLNFCLLGFSWSMLKPTFFYLGQAKAWYYGFGLNQALAKNIFGLNFWPGAMK
jgi:hypothetical protein